MTFVGLERSIVSSDSESETAVVRIDLPLLGGRPGGSERTKCPKPTRVLLHFRRGAKIVVGCADGNRQQGDSIGSESTVLQNELTDLAKNR
jgi:hypothetical protein